MREASTPALSPISRIVVLSNPCWPKRDLAACSSESLLAAASRDRPAWASLGLPLVAFFMVTFYPPLVRKEATPRRRPDPCRPARLRPSSALRDRLHSSGRRRETTPSVLAAQN